MKNEDLLSISKSDSGRMGAPKGPAKAKCCGPGRPAELVKENGARGSGKMGLPAPLSRGP